MAKFVFNDENIINSYGFCVNTKGISLKRFSANPVMLEQHYNSTSAVLGRWKDWKKEDALLTGEDDFDTEDDDAAKVKGKVDRGFIKGCSMGISFLRDDMKQRPDGVWELTKCELYEVSIVAIPSNSAALRLYAAATGELLTEDEVKLQLSALLENKPLNLTNMYKVTLSLAALKVLGLANTDDATALAAAIEKVADDNNKLQANLTAEQTARKALEDTITAQLAAKTKTMLDAAELAGKITATTRPQFEQMATQNFSLCESVLATIPAKTSLSNLVNNPATGEVKTDEDFQKLTTEQQLAWKEANPEAYKKLFA